MTSINGFDSSEIEIIEREAREGNTEARALLSGQSVDPAVIVKETKDQRRNRLIREHSARIQAGEIDIGPLPIHKHEDIADIVDHRDPSALGATLLDKSQKYGSILN